jgi:succinate dehydrogenase / fumarate reductase, cytochrome b subunit
MADVPRASNKPNRPLSPHLQVYQPLINMVMSIFHRITGVGLYVGSLLLVVWLVSATLDRDLFERINGLLGTWFGQLVLLGFTWAYLHHLLGGVRHLIWDSGAGFDLPTVKMLSWGTLVLSVLGTASIWLLAAYV